MTGRLVAAQVWRLRWQLMILMMGGANSVSTASDPTAFSSRLSMAMPLLFSFASISTLGFFWSRDVRVLPIPRPVALRSAWLSALVLPLAIMIGRTVGVLVHLAFGSTDVLGLQAIGLAAVRDTIFVGVILTIMQGDNEPFESVRETFGVLRKSPKVLLPAFWLLAVPFASPEVTPTSLADVTWLHLAGVIVAIIIILWPLVTKPDQWPALGVLHDAPRNAAARPVRPDTAPHRFDRLKGLRRLLPGAVGTAALVAILTLGAGTALIVSLENVKSPFSSAMQDMHFFMIGGPLFLLILGPFGWANGVTPFLRPLKALPVSAMQIVVALTLLPLMMPVFFWLLAAGVHLAVGAPGDTSWRLEAFALLCGAMAFSGAVYARFNSVIVILAGCSGPVIGVLMLMMFFDKVAIEPVTALWFPILGFIGVPAAFLMNYRTVTRGSSSSPAYRGVPGASLYRGSRP